MAITPWNDTVRDFKEINIFLPSYEPIGMLFTLDSYGWVSRKRNINLRIENSIKDAMEEPEAEQYSDDIEDNESPGDTLTIEAPPVQRKRETFFMPGFYWFWPSSPG